MTDADARIRVVRCGPLVVEGIPLARVVKGESSADGSRRWKAERLTAGTSYLLCRCNGSATKPFCDRWPGTVCFQERQPNGQRPVFTWRPPDDVEGPLVSIKPNGPFRVSGGARIDDEDGSVIDDGERVSLCRCGHSSAMPFCDGSHKEVGFHDG
jgi:CDGSH-type Zn-finger protein